MFSGSMFRVVLNKIRMFFCNLVPPKTFQKHTGLQNWYSGFPKVVSRKGLKNAKFLKVVAFAQSKLVAQPKVVAFSAQLLLETLYIIFGILFGKIFL